MLLDPVYTGKAMAGLIADVRKRQVTSDDVVIFIHTGGVRDWLEDGVNGLCVRPGHAGDLARALNELLSDASLGQAMGAAGRRSVSARFNAERHLRLLLDAYRRAGARWARVHPRSSARAGAPVSSSA